MKKLIILPIAIALIGIFAPACIAQEVVWENISRENLDLNTVLVNRDNPKIIYAGSNKGVIKTENAGESWRNVLTIRGENTIVNFLAFDHKNRNYIYAAAGNGLYFSSNRGRNWNRIFKGKNYFESECTALAVLPYGIYLGTKAGVFLSKDNGRTWHKEPGILGNSRILNISYNLSEPDYIYIASLNGVFKTSDAGKNWEKIFIAHPAENSDNADAISEGQDEPARLSGIKYISIDQNNLNYLYVSAKKGIYKSQDKGKTWNLLSDYGLLDKDVKFLLLSDKSNLYAAAKSGIFVYEQDRWHELSQRLLAEEARFLVQDKHHNLYAASDKGLFKGRILNLNNGNQGPVPQIYYKDAPSINEVQQAAIRYAEVEPEKIQKWRKLAEKKAWLPRVSVGLDRNVTGLWHWEGGSTAKTDDDILRRGRDSVEWDVSLSWDLGELIWNNDQASIDVRSRLMVELREDILDQVTKLYFERLRVKMELNNITIEDRKKRFEKELKLQELTALLDALTNGYFSRQIIKNKEHLLTKS